ncbi:hypothetical protein Tco_0472047 [Tanacetum coccineum]
MTTFNRILERSKFVTHREYCLNRRTKGTRAVSDESKQCQDEALSVRHTKIMELGDNPIGKNQRVYAQEEGIILKNHLLPVARLEAVRIFVAYVAHKYQFTMGHTGIRRFCFELIAITMPIMPFCVDTRKALLEEIQFQGDNKSLMSNEAKLYCNVIRKA